MNSIRLAHLASIAAVPRHHISGAASIARPKLKLACIALLVVATVLAYWPVFHGGFIFDDNVFLTDNPLIHASDGLSRFWFSREATDYWPVTSSTLWLEWRLWGMNATGYHATNLALHLAEAFIFWVLLRRLHVPGAWIGALLFALHPVNAESVAWITERKNLMAMLFYLLSILWFVQSSTVESAVPNALDRRRVLVGPLESIQTATRSAPGNIYYWLSLFAFVLAMLSKGSTVILPLILLGIIVWHRRPNVGDVAKLAPFFVIAAGLAIVEAGFSTVSGLDEMQALGILPRLLRAAAVICFYAGKAVWPANLCFDYGPWNLRVNDPSSWLPLIAVLAVTTALWRFRRSWTRPALFGWAYFCVALSPVMGFAEVGFMRYSPVSDHYAHLALPGVCALAGAGWAWLMADAAGQRHEFRRRVHVTAVAVAIGICGVLTWKQSGIYADAMTLYRDTIARNPDSWIAQTNLGALLGEAGNNEEAIAHLETAVRLKPEWEESHTDLGLAYYRGGRLPDAILQYETALRARPESYHAHNNLGAALARSGKMAEATAHFEESLRIRPNYRDAQLNLDRARRMEREGNAARSRP